jgi:DNA-binding CsgD family transcriptional regulator
MFVTSSERQALQSCFALLAEDHNEEEIRRRLGRVMLDLLQADHFASYVWNAETRSFDRGLSLHMDPANLRKYEAWYQYRDPITFLLQSRRHATLVSEVMPRRDLLRCEFFNDFLARDGLHWGINLHAFDGNQQALGDLRIWRGRQRREFEERDRLLLDLVEPAFVAALRRARDAKRGASAAAAAAAAAASGQPDLGGLSPREYEVANCVARGLTNKEIARELSIALPSVNTYLRRVFQKTGVHRRAALAQWARRFH